MTSVIVSSIRAERVFPVPDILLNRIFDTEATNMAIPITKTEILYYVLLLVGSYIYLKKAKWQNKKI